jgi:hypothetical protein
VFDQFWGTALAFLQRLILPAVCITKQSRPGIVPSWAKPGDEIFVPHGSKVPFVVRKHGDRGCYKIIGECSIEGIMYHDGHVPDEVVLQLI